MNQINQVRTKKKKPATIFYRSFGDTIEVNLIESQAKCQKHLSTRIHNLFLTNSILVIYPISDYVKQKDTNLYHKRQTNTCSQNSYKYH